MNMKSHELRQQFDHHLASVRKLGNSRSSEGLRTFSPSHGIDLAVFLMLEGDTKMNSDPGFSVGFAKSTVKHQIR